MSDGQSDAGVVNAEPSDNNANKLMIDYIFSSDLMISIIVVAVPISIVAVGYFWLRGRKDPYRHGGRSRANYIARREGGVTGPASQHVNYEYEGLGDDQRRREQEIGQIKSRLASLEKRVEIMSQELTGSDKRTAHESDRPLIKRYSEGDGYQVIGGTGAKSHSYDLETLDSVELAREAYRRIISEGMGALPREPVFATLDTDSMSRVGETKRHFKQSTSKQSAFVILQKGSIEGWLFPNPQITFTEGMTYVFPDLSHVNFQKMRLAIEPRQVRLESSGTWETLEA